ADGDPQPARRAVRADHEHPGPRHRRARARARHVGRARPSAARQVVQRRHADQALRVAGADQALTHAWRAYRRDPQGSAGVRRKQDQELEGRRRSLHATEEGSMKIAIIGQQDFGKAVLEAFLARKDEVAGVFCAPEKPGARPDALKVAAQEKGVPVYQFQSLKGDEAKAALKKLNVELGIMAFVLQFAPQDFVNIPKRGTIQYHPSLLPKYRGPSSINWPIIRGDSKTGLTIFRPTDGFDEGPVVLQKETPIGPDDTLGTVYFDRLFPMGVKAMVEAADLVVSNKQKELVQDESQATYEGWCRKAEARLNWANHVDFI